MFILRTVFGTHSKPIVTRSITNMIIGDFYEVVFNSNKEKFDSYLEMNIPDKEQVIAFLIYHDKDKECFVQLYEKNSYYIMNDSGKTFQAINS